MKIELYLNSAKGLIYSGDPCHGSGRPAVIKAGHGPPMGYRTVKQSITKLSLDEKESALIVRLEHIAKQHNIKFKIYDVAKTRHTVLAYIKGVREIPTIRIGRLRVTGDITDITEGELTKVLKEQLNKSFRFRLSKR